MQTALKNKNKNIVHSKISCKETKICYTNTLRISNNSKNKLCKRVANNKSNCSQEKRLVILVSIKTFSDPLFKRTKSNLHT